MSYLQKNQSTQTSGPVFAETIEKAKKTKNELELIKIVEYFLNGNGNEDSNLVSFKMKSLKKSFLLQVVRVMSIPKENKMLVKKEIPKKKFKSCQNLIQNFYSLSDFKPSCLQRVRF